MKSCHLGWDKFLMVLGCCLGTSNAKAQPGSYPTGQINYVRAWDLRSPNSDANIIISLPVKDAAMTTSYIDGMGRNLQTVEKGGSLETNGTATDMVHTSLFDGYGREQYRYLNFPANNTGGNTSINDGGFKLNPFAQQAAFYSNHFSSQGESVYFSQVEFEASPLNREYRVNPAGNNWAGSNRGSARGNGVNTSIDDVKKWIVMDVPNNLGNYIVNGQYAEGDLNKYYSTDENGKQVIEFKNRAGQVILTKRQFSSTGDNGSGIGYPGWICKYYIYDGLGNLRCVIQPEGVKALSTGAWAFTSTILDEQCFRYEYDSRQRMVIKKLPGSGEIWMVYDNRDRLVLFQSANLRASAQQQWNYILYDALNRQISTGLWSNSQDRAFHQAQSANNANYPNLSGQIFEELTATFYDDYDWIGINGNPVSSQYNSTYDTYFQTASNTQWPYPQSNIVANIVHGKVTGSKTRIVGTNTFLYICNWYDQKGRLIQAYSTNQTGGTDIVTSQYSWSGQALITVHRQQVGGTASQSTTLVTQNTYDDLGRLVKEEKKLINSQLNNNNAGYTTTSQNEYNKLGQLKKKSLGNSPTMSGPLENLNFDYNIRGWLLGMNRKYLRDANASDFQPAYFGFDLGYDKNESAVGYGNWNGYYWFQNYTGVISGTTWRSKGDGIRRKLDFEYDEVYRFGKSYYSQNTSGSAAGSWTASEMDFSTHGYDPDNNYKIKYDYNGNLTGMVQRGFRLGAPTADIDALHYVYNGGSNRLKYVNDDLPNTNLGDFHDGQNALGTNDYDYDNEGNLVTDKNKDFVSISYNPMNLPLVITTSKGTVTFTYDAYGRKLQKVVNEPASTLNNNVQSINSTRYIDGFTYETKTINGVDQYVNKLQFISFEEGRVRFKYDNPAMTSVLTGFVYDYMVKDHLGNVRMVLTEEQRQDYYPAATLEGSTNQGDLSMINYEKLFYEVSATKVVSKPWTDPAFDYMNNNGIANPYPQGYTTNINSISQKVYKLNSTSNLNTDKTGLGIVLKVMAGDNINIFGKSYHKMPSGGGYTAPPNNIILTDLINAFASSGIVSGHGATGTNILNQPNFPASVAGMVGTQSQTAGRPKAAINWIVFNDQFKYVSGGFDMVGDAGSSTNGTLKTHDLNTIPTISIPQNGYIYVYCSNESQYDVYFDNLQVVHGRSPILEETHYYPFGLTMAGISSKALAFGEPGNQLKYNGKEVQVREFSDGSGLDMVDYEARMYDNQIGRWQTLDPLSEKFNSLSPFSFCGNDPISHREIDGMWFNDGNEIFESFISFSLREAAKVGRQISNNEAAIAKATLEGKNTVNLCRQLNELKAREGQLIAAIKEGEALRSSKQEYNIYTWRDDVAGTGNGQTLYNIGKNSVDILLRRDDVEKADLAHELKHAYQFETQRLSFASDGMSGGYIADKNDEREAFDRAYAYGDLRSFDDVLQRGAYKNANSDPRSAIMDRPNGFGTYLYGLRFSNVYQSKREPGTVAEYYKGWQEDLQLFKVLPQIITNILLNLKSN